MSIICFIIQYLFTAFHPFSRILNSFLWVTSTCFLSEPKFQTMACWNIFVSEFNYRQIFSYWSEYSCVLPIILNNFVVASINQFAYEPNIESSRNAAYSVTFSGTVCCGCKDSKWRIIKKFTNINVPQSTLQTKP